ncbi:MAG: hypothetical protein DMD50_17585 [Gemmatimonadetes bacterium]|nr:MAG: hypothetical protein DMD50_17585 [Gemmatimonadota bacterium]
MRSTRDLTSDGALRLVLDRPLVPLAERWVPEEPGGATSRPATGARIDVRCSARAAPRPRSAATLSVGTVCAWVDERHGVVQLHAALASSSGAVSLASRVARLCADPASGDEAASDLYSMLTISAALLVAGLGRALLHAAAVVAPDGTAWLLVGDARSGKSTTCANLARAGWGYLSDDQTVLAATEQGVVVEGWLRSFHLDEGWQRGEVSGRRRTIHPAALGIGGQRRVAPLAGILLPVVAPERPTSLAPISAGQALAELVRQSPWLLAHRAVAAAGITVLSRAAQTPAFALTLGLDTYGDPARLRALVTTAGSGPPLGLRGSEPGLPLEPRAAARRQFARRATAP